MPTNVLVLGAGFGGLELTTRLSETLGSDVHVTLIDKSDSFVFGFNKFDVIFGWKTLDEVRGYYRDIAKPGVTVKHENITSIDPISRRVVTDGGAYEADIMVVGLGAEYDFAATPGLVEGGHEFYSIPALSSCVNSFQPSRAAASSSPSSANRTSVRPPRARWACCCTSGSQNTASARTFPSP
jgi:sulfide:quinone oxidoreductase